MILISKAIGRILRWLDRYAGDMYVAYLHARWPDKFMDPKEDKR